MNLEPGKDYTLVVSLFDYVPDYPEPEDERESNMTDLLGLLRYALIVALVAACIVALIVYAPFLIPFRSVIIWLIVAIAVVTVLIRALPMIRDGQ